MEVVTMESKAKEAASECRSHRLDSAGEDRCTPTHTHTHTKDIGHLPGIFRDKEIEESFLCLFGLVSSLNKQPAAAQRLGVLYEMSDILLWDTHKHTHTHTSIPKFQKLDFDTQVHQTLTSSSEITLPAKFGSCKLQNTLNCWRSPPYATRVTVGYKLSHIWICR